tara:strand:+ start:260 stop:1114 length:855 start_codon:yes stop_codon:yes gene_type:complete
VSKILIVGDSNGLGEWGTVVPGPGVANGSELFRPYNDEWYLQEPHAKPFNVIWPGFGYYLDLKGHATVNYSIGGGNNTEALFKVEEALGLAPPFTSPVFYNPDVIAWVVTEPIRDLQPPRWPPEAGLKDLEKYFVQRDKIVEEATSIADMNSRLIKMCLDNAQKIYNETKIPWIIIEGWGKLPQDLSQYNFIKHVHRNWMDKILGHEIPAMSSWPTINLLRRARTDLADASAIIKTAPESEFKRIVDSYEDTIKTMETSDTFPDNCHPNRKVHEQLATELEPYV